MRISDWSSDVCSSDLHGFTSLRRSAEHGFTLVELMVVIVIIGLLATIVAVNALPATGKARTAKATADIATPEQALDQYRPDNLTYPTAHEGRQALAPPTTPPPPRPPYPPSAPSP